MENDDGANQQSDPTEMEENSNFNDRPQISRQNSVKSLESLQPLASSTMIGDDLTMIGKSVENDLNSSTQKVSYTINMEQIKIVVLYNEHLTVTSFQQNLQAPINTNDQDLVPVNNLVEQEICQPFLFFQMHGLCLMSYINCFTLRSVVAKLTKISRIF